MTDHATRGEKWLVRVREEYELSASAEELVIQAARLIDRVDALDEVVATEGVMATSSQGIRAHPALVEARQSRAALHRILTTVDLPYGEDDE